ncbi:MAG: flippase-like domain-containing protein [Desulfarculaceae bacterium]|nr:flippase-like domain-containing protein [Desulfarculaceae bacterium]MCF8073507.1 flippase-like domain-containing protein [Desulfarculaceae bacterium]MCF8100346.1 flippase-like domain-containing protein [Desulfarculaceae bacterium]MCF8117539.1 flippase-like domain-containing protein [Desulfarculaceae bacterium]
MWKQYLVGLLVSVAAVYFFFKAAPPSQMLASLDQLNPWWLIPGTLVYIGSYCFRAMRWHYLMRPVAKVRFRPLFAALMIGFLGNNILPAHLGEVVRAVVLGRTEQVSKSATMATVVLERVYDGLTVLLMLLVVLLFVDLPTGQVEGSLITTANLRTAGWLGLVLFAGLLIALQAFRWQRAASLRFMTWILKPVPERFSSKLLAGIDSFADGLALARVGDLIGIGVYSLLTWLTLALWAWLFMLAFGIHLDFMAGVLMEVVLALALLIPAAPAFVGTFHLAAAATLAFMGANPGVAGSYAMVIWLDHFVSTTLLGIYYLWRLGLGWGTLTGKQKS